MLGAKDLLVKIAGDNSSFKKAMSGANTSMGGFASSLKKHAATAALAFAGMATAFAAMAVKMAAAEEVVNRKTESILKSQGIMWSSVKDEVTDYINELEALTTYGDTDLQMAFNRMASSGMSYKQTMESMNMVTDIAYTKDISLVAAADLVSKAYNGQGSSLKRYGIILKEGVTGLEALNDMQLQVNKTMGEAEDQFDTVTGKVKGLKNQVDDATEAFGARLTPELSFMLDTADDLNIGLEDIGDTLGQLVALPITLPRQLGEHVANMKTVNDQRKIGVDTEKEWVSLLRLGGTELGEMSDIEFKRKQTLLTAAGYHEKAVQVEKERNYVIRQLEIVEANRVKVAAQLLEIEESITKESEKQLSLAERKAAFEARAATRAGFAGVSGSTMAGLRETAGAYEAGEAYTRTSGGRTITYSGNKSGI